VIRPLVTLVAILIASHASPAHAYEFWMRSQTIAQAYQLREYKLIGPDVLLGRRRFTQTLALRIWDIGDYAKDRRIARRPEKGVRVSWQSYLRVDHDFGTYANGRITIVNTRRDALDVIPELDESLLVFDLMYGFLEVAGIADDRVTLRVGRLPADDGWGTTGIDGGSVRVELPQPVAVTATAGLRVRASSPAGLSSYELDGTGGAACREYVEAATAGTGTWKLIDRNRAISGGQFTSDLEFCPQREKRQPTIGFAIATSRIRNFGAEVGYRRTFSGTVGLIGPEDRLDFPDRGLYPNEFGQAPAYGVNEEYVYARVHGELVRRDLTIGPFANARVSLLHAALDRFDAGVRLTHERHTFEPAIGYFLPTFDGDSIFNVFSIEPTTDARLGYRHDGKVQLDASAWLRRYTHLDDTSSVAGGFSAGAERMLSPRWRGRADALWDDGYGGRRVGGSATAFWRARQTLWLRGRAIVLGVAEEADASAQRRSRYVTSSTVFGATWKLGDNAALHAIGEANYDEIHDTQLRVIAILDLAFAPEP
jgi:hypothetical protein